MSSFATRRLVDATAALPPAERALLNLWVNRGFDDPALARMTGMTIEAIAARRERIVGRLSDELGLPPDEVLGALAQIAAGASAGAGANPPTPVHQPDGQAGAAGDPRRAAEPRRRRRVRVAIGGLLTLILIAVLALDSSSSPRRGTPIRAVARGPITTSAAAPASSAGPRSSGPAVSPPGGSPFRSQPLAPLPGASSHASGAAVVLGSRVLRLRLTVRGLIPAAPGHYEIWLYNSIIDSTALGRLRPGARAVTLRLPRDARRYRWIDISLQPLGIVLPSGGSKLRAANPAAGRAG